jgi:hypothetical protein
LTGRVVGEKRSARIRATVQADEIARRISPSISEIIRKAIGTACTKAFHLDYFFRLSRFGASSEAEHFGSAAWCKRSDHSPIVLDIPDRAF